MVEPVRYCLHGIDLELDEMVPAWPLSAKQATDRWIVRVDHAGSDLVEAGLVRTGDPQWYWTGEPTSAMGICALTITGGPGEGSATRYVVDTPARSIDISYTHAAAEGWEGVVELLNRWVVAGIARSSSGALPLHATSVVRNGQALLIAGVSGSGKSTLTWALLKAGAELLGDEPAVVRTTGRECAVWPGEASVRLHQPGRVPAGLTPAGTRFGKSIFRAASSRVAGEPIPVLAVCLLGPRTTAPLPQVTRLSADHALSGLMAQRYAFAGRPQSIRSDFTAAARLAASGKVVQLAMPDGLDRVASAAALLWDAVEGVLE